MVKREREREVSVDNWCCAGYLIYYFFFFSFAHVFHSFIHPFVYSSIRLDYSSIRFIIIISS